MSFWEVSRSWCATPAARPCTSSPALYFVVVHFCFGRFWMKRAPFQRTLPLLFVDFDSGCYLWSCVMVDKSPCMFRFFWLFVICIVLYCFIWVVYSGLLLVLLELLFLLLLFYRICRRLKTLNSCMCIGFWLFTLSKPVDYPCFVNPFGCV